MVVNKYAKYRQPAAPSPEEEPQEPVRVNKYARFREAEAQQQANPMVAQGQAAQQAWRDGGAKPANPNPENPIITAQRNSQAQANSAFHEERRPRTDAELAAAKAAKGRSQERRSL